MNLVVDTNILISFFRENPVRAIILGSELFCLQLYTPEQGFKELLNIRQDISKYSKLSLKDIEFTFEELKKHVKIISEESFQDFEEQAKKLIHDKDIPFFSLALSLNCAIWSNEPAFKEQSSVEIFNTQDLRNIFKI